MIDTRCRYCGLPTAHPEHSCGFEVADIAAGEAELRREAAEDDARERAEDDAREIRRMTTRE